jgi:hypothetical protein
LEGWSDNKSWLNNLYKLEKLKRLRVVQGVSPNILEHLKFGIFNNLEELDAEFEGASMESVREMKRITPNLKKVEFLGVMYSDAINALLDTMENLESVKLDGINLMRGEGLEDLEWVKIQNPDWKMSDTVHPNIKHLHVRCVCKFNAEKKLIYFVSFLPC